MGLHIHRADRADVLVSGLAEVLAEPPADPMTLDVVSVPAKGIERWLTQQLSHRLGRSIPAGADRSDSSEQDGICAGVRFPSPAALVAEVVGARDADPWLPDRLVWPLISVIDETAGEPWAQILTRHLGALDPDDDRRSRRYPVARRLAGLFDSYATYRPGMLAAWVRGEDSDGYHAPLPADLAFQAPLWRAVRARIDGPDPLQRSADALSRLATEPAAVDLPERLSLFGPTRIPAAQRSVLEALAVSREVHLWLTHPSAGLWDGLVAAASTGRSRPAGRRSADHSGEAARHPLLATLGRESRELELVAPAADTDVALPVERSAATLLGRLQLDIAADRPITVAAPAPPDRSVQVHACHGPGRQVEVLREVIVGLLQDDSTLEPRDVLVMCPDIEQYAPLIAAGFGLADVVEYGHPAHGLRVRLADRALQQTNPLLATVTRLLDLVGSRATASQVLDLAAWAPVRLRFAFSDDELETLADWVSAAGVRWGFDVRTRSEFGLGRVPQNTWAVGMDRILLGVAMAEEGRNWLGLALPLDGVGSADIDLAGRLAEFVDRLGTALSGLSGRLTVTQWVDRLLDAVESLAQVRDADGWQRAELRRQLTLIADDAGAGADLGVPEMRALLAGRLAGRPTRSNFRTGTLTVCTMTPMRSVPHRVICLLGLDDGIFPRGGGLDGDDVLARDPAVGERDPRGEDRQLLLDAIMAAGSHLVVTYAGSDDRTGSTRPPAVPIGELLDTLATATDGAFASVVHPLQPYDIKVVTPGALGVPGPFSFDPSALAAARAAEGIRVDPPDFLPRPLTGPFRSSTDGVVELTGLIDLLTGPAKGFLRQRLDLSTPGDDEPLSDSLSVDLNGLEKWKIGDRLLRLRLAGVDADTCGQLEYRRGELPPGKLGSDVLMSVLESVDELIGATVDLRAEPAAAVDISLDLPDGRVLRGTVPGVRGTRLVGLEYSRLGPKHRLTAWIRLLALVAGGPDRPWSATTAGAGGSGSRVMSLTAPARPGAVELIGQLVTLYDRGLAQPLPVPLKTAAAYADARRRGRSVEQALEAAGVEWTGFKFPGESAAGEHVRIWGPHAPLAAVTAALAPVNDRWPDEDTVFGVAACRLWLPLLEHERQGR